MNVVREARRWRETIFFFLKKERESSGKRSREKASKELLKKS